MDLAVPYHKTCPVSISVSFVFFGAFIEVRLLIEAEQFSFSPTPQPLLLVHDLQTPHGELLLRAPKIAVEVERSSEISM
jgi:hypothetical protein